MAEEHPISGHRCFYCGGSLLGNERPEHIIPAAAGGTLTTIRVCDPCNTRAGKEVDAPWLRDPHVMHLRAKYGVHDRRDQPVRPQAISAALDDGRKARVIDHGSHVEIHPVRRVTKDDAAGTVRVESTPAEFPKIAERLEREHGSLRWAPSRSGPTTLTATATLEVSVETWPRLAAKVTLGVMSRFVDDSWVDSERAASLRSILWSGARQVHALDKGGWAWAAVPEIVDRSKPPAALLNDAEHLLCFESDQMRSALVIVLFSELLYRVPVDATDVNSISPSWLFDSIRRELLEMPAPLLSLALKGRRMQEDEQRATT